MEKYYQNKIGQILDNNMNVIEQGDGIEAWENYVTYLKNGGQVFFLNEGDEVPETVTAIQFITQLELDGITEDMLLQIIENFPSPTKELARTSLKRAVFFERNNPLITVIGQSLGKTNSEIDMIFINASKI
jgi:hypothetical protein